MKYKKTNWHIATTSAIKIDLRDYSDILSYETEFSFWKNQFRLDMIIIKKTVKYRIDNPLAREFGPINLFEIKGIGSSVSISVFLKSLAYAPLYAIEYCSSSPLAMRDITINLLSRSYPRKLMDYLVKKCHFVVEKRSPGIYHVGGVGFSVFIIVTRMLPAEDFLYLSCVTNNLQDSDLHLIEQLGSDIKANWQQDSRSYFDYVEQLHNAYTQRKDDSIAMAVKDKVKNIREMSLSELNRRYEQQNVSLSELSRKYEQQKEAYETLSELNRKYENEKEGYEKTISDMVQEIERLKRELLEMKTND